MKPQIESLLRSALEKLQQEGVIETIPSHIQIEPTRDKSHGDFASNIALTMAKQAQKKPRDMAQLLLNAMEPASFIKKVEIAGPGFINFFLSNAALSDVVTKIITEKENFGLSKLGRNKRILVEFLSSNPTGPLHVGHGRQAVFGDVICNLLNAVGFNAYREYYVNDAGRQMDIITVSIWMRYLVLCGEAVPFPANAYRGDYVVDMAKALYQMHQNHFQMTADALMKDLPLDEPQGGDKEIYIDALIARAKSHLTDKYRIIYDLALANIVADMREDLAEFGVHYDNWFSERQFVASNAVTDTIKKLKASGHVYEHENALWFRSTDFGDEKDRVLIRSNGQLTYFGPDVAYHLNKFERGFDLAIDIFGADHHGYLPRMKAAMQALDINPERLILLLVQFVSLFRGGLPVQMSTRGGSFVTLRELREEVGNDAARYFYVMRKAEQPIDFDLDLAKAKSNENPVYYVQYAYARICSVFKQLEERQCAI